MGLSLKAAVGFWGKGSLISKILAVVLSAFSFAFFALATSGYTFTEEEFFVEAYLSQLQRSPYLVYYANIRGIEGMKQFRPLLEDENVKLMGVIEDPILFKPENFLPDFGEEFSKDPDHQNFSYMRYPLCGSAEQCEFSNYSLLAGRYASSEDEVVIAKDYFEAFRKYGYSDNRNLYEPYEDEDDKGYIMYKFHTEAGANERQEINTYSDIIGKKVAACDDNFYLDLTIVGVYDNTNFRKYDEDFYFDSCGANAQLTAGGNPVILLSDAFEKKYGDSGNSLLRVNALMARVNDEMKQRSSVKKIVKNALAIVDYCLLNNTLKDDPYFGESYRDEDYTKRHIYDNSGMFGALKMIGPWDTSNSLWAGSASEAISVAAIGCFLFAIAVILNASLITDVMYWNRKEIGVLRAIGYRKRSILKMIFISTLFLAFAIFVISSIITTGLYWGWFRETVTFNRDYVRFIINGWTYLILFGMSVSVPILSAIIPIFIFFKRPIVENIKARE